MPTESERLLNALDALVAAATAQGSRIAEGLQPGLSEADLRERLAPFVLDPPNELITLFGWHDGSRPDDLDSWFGPVHSFLALDKAIEDYEFIQEPDMIEVWVRVGDIEHTEWFPLIDFDGAWVLMDCHRESASRGKVVGYRPEDGMPAYRAALTEPLERWAGYINSGVWRREPDGRWLIHESQTREQQEAQGNLF